MMADDPRVVPSAAADPVFALVEEVEELKRQVAERDETIAKMEETIKVNVDLYHRLLKDFVEIKKAMEALEAQSTIHSKSRFSHLDIRDEIEALKSRPPSRSDLTTDRLSRLDKLLFECYPRSLTFDEIGKLLQFGVNHTQIMTSFSKHLIPYADDRYIFGDSIGRVGTGRTIRLTPRWKEHLDKNKILWDDK